MNPKTVASLIKHAQTAVTRDSRKMRWDLSKPRELQEMIKDLEHQLSTGPHGAEKNAVRYVVDGFVRSLGRDKQRLIPKQPQGFSFDEYRELVSACQALLRRYNEEFGGAMDDLIGKYFKETGD